MINREEKSGANLKLGSRSKNKKRNRILSAGASLDQPKTNMALSLLNHENDQEDKKPAQISLLSSLMVVLVALYVVFPSFVKQFELEKKEEIVHIPAGGYPVKAQKKHRQQPEKVIKKEVIPRLYPEIVEVEIENEEQVSEDSSADWSALDVEGTVEGYDFGNGGSGGSPIVNAGDGGMVPNPELIYEVQPDYPDAGRTARVAGYVLMEAIINEKGDVVNIKILSQPQARFGFGEKAVEAVNKWKYKPSIYIGHPVSVRVQFMVDFDLVY